MLIAGKVATYILASSLMALESPLKVDLNELGCMVEVIHFEAQGESHEGRKGVANVVLNRVDSKYYPDTICEVVHQDRQFSYRNSIGSPKVQLKNRLDVKSFKKTVDIALSAVQNDLKDNTGGSKHYFNHDLVIPNWYSKDKVKVVIANHTFMKLREG